MELKDERRLSLKSFRYILFVKKTLFWIFRRQVARVDAPTHQKTAAGALLHATTLHERRRSKRAAVKALPEPHAQQPLQRCPQRRAPAAAANTRQNSSTATRISLLAIPLLAVTLALRRETGPRVFTKAELAQYVDTSRGLKVAICGQVFDVTKGAEFYAKGAGYGFFAGRDASAGLCDRQLQDEPHGQRRCAGVLFRASRRWRAVAARRPREHRVDGVEME